MPMNNAPNPSSTGPQMWVPVSGQIYKQDYGTAIAHLSLTVTINPTLVAGSTVLAEISEDGLSNWFAYGRVGVQAGVSLAGNVQQLMLLVPTGWSYRVTTSNATLGTMILIGQQ